MAKGDTRLGKGLGALLGEYLDEPERTRAAEREVPVEAIRSNPYQPRRRFAEESLRELAASIRHNGLLQPLIVRRVETGWEIVAGERRWRAIRTLGWEKAPVVERELTEEQMLVLALVENLQREDLSPLEEAGGYRQLMEGFGLTQAQVGKHVGRDRSTVANMLRLLGLPEAVREMLAEGRISAGHARALLALESEVKQIELAREIHARGLSVRQVERRIRRTGSTRKRASSSRARGRSSAEPAVRRAELLLERALGTQVRIRTSGEGGEIGIGYHDADDFERLVRLLSAEAGPQLFEAV